MIVSSKGRYILRVLIDLAENQKDNYIPLKEIAKRQNISLKYLEQIIPILTKNKYIVGIPGKKGGYRLNNSPEKYIIGEILRLIEGNLAPVSCLKNNEECKNKSSCRTIIMWNNLNKLINDYLDNITIKDLMQV